LALILVASLVIKLGIALLVDGVVPVNDEESYLSLAMELVKHGRYDTLFRPPLYPGFLAGIFALGGTTLWVRLSQALLGTLSVWLVYGIARDSAGHRVGLVAACLVAFDPLLIFFSAMLWSETLYIVLWLLGVRLIAIGQPLAARASWNLLLAGLCFGLAALARPQVLTLMPLTVVWIVYNGWRDQANSAGANSETKSIAPLFRELARPIALLTLGCCAAVLPWTARNALKTETFVLIDTNGAYNFLVSTEPEAAFLDKDDTWSPRWARFDGVHYRRAADHAPTRVQSLAVERALENIATDPLRFAQKSLWEAGHLWTLDSFLLRHLRNGWFGRDTPDWWLPISVLFSVSFSAFLVFFGMLGMAAHPISPLRSFSIMAVAHATLLFGLTYSLSRYALPLRPLLAVFAAWAIAGPGGFQVRLSAAWDTRAKRVLLSLVLLALASVWLRDLPLLWDNLVNDGTHYLFRGLR
jgi:hypothetical protein